MKLDITMDGDKRLILSYGELPRFEIVNVSVSPTSVTVGTKVRISWTVANYGDIDGDATVSITADGITISGSYGLGNIPAGQTRTYTIYWTPRYAGTYSITVKFKYGYPGATFGSAKSTTLKVSYIAPPSPPPPTPTTYIFKLRAIADGQAVSVNATLDGKTYTTPVSIYLTAGKTYTVTLPDKITVAGVEYTYKTHTIS